jgi:hypothetical protein
VRIFRPWVLGAALAAGIGSAILLPVAPASAMSPCMSNYPPDWCYGGTTAPVPAAPTNLALVSVLQTSVTLQWTDNSTNETAWRVQRTTVVGNTSTTQYLQPSSTSTTTTGTVSWTDTTASPSSYVTYRVAAVDANPRYDEDSYSGSTGPVNGSTKPQPASPILGLTYSPYDDGSTYFGIHGTAVDWDTTGPIQVLVSHDGALLPALTANTYSSGFNQQNPGYGDYHGFATWVTKKTTKGQHQVCVEPVNVGGGTTPGWTCRSYKVYGPPSAATNVTATVGATAVTVKFKDNADDETGWFLQRSTDNQASWYAVGGEQPAISGVGGTGTAVDYSTPAAGTCYRILMVNGYGQTPSAAACTP